MKLIKRCFICNEIIWKFIQKTGEIKPEDCHFDCLEYMAEIDEKHSHQKMGLK